MAKLYGLGVGPGDPQLITLKAAGLMKSCPVIMVPRSGKDVNVALAIARGAVPEIMEKDIVEVDMPMVRDHKTLQESHDKAADTVCALLEEGRDVAFLTLGDPTIYSTYIYVHNRVLGRGYEAEIVPGIPSFCAAAARLNTGLTEGPEMLHVIPASYEGIEEAVRLPGTKVLMKSGKSIAKVKQLLRETEGCASVQMVERCGMEGERIFRTVDEIDDNAGYFSLLVVKEK